MINPNEYLEMGLQFHGHKCPAMPMGLRTAAAAMNSLGVGRTGGSALFALVELGDSHCATCFSDGAAGDEFGFSVSVSRDRAIVGALRDDNENGQGSGAAHIFMHSGTNWTQQAKLLAADGPYQDCFGGSVSLSGATAVIGVYGDDEN